MHFRFLAARRRRSRGKCLFNDPRRRGNETFGAYCATFCTRPSFVAFHFPFQPLFCLICRAFLETRKSCRLVKKAEVQKPPEKERLVCLSDCPSACPPSRPPVCLSAASGPSSPPRPNNVMNRAASAFAVTSSGRRSLSSLWRRAKLLAG